MANQTQNLAAMLENFEGVQKAYDLAMESAGSATQENARYMESLGAKAHTLKLTFEDLVLGDGGIHDFIAVTLDAGTAILKGLQNPAVQATLKVVTLTAVILELNKAIKGIKLWDIGKIYDKDGVGGLLAKLGAAAKSGKLFATIGSSLASAFPVAIFSSYIVAFEKLHKATMDYKADLENLTPDYQSFDTLQKKIEETNKTFEYSEAEISVTDDKVKEYTATLVELGYSTNRTDKENKQLKDTINAINKVFPNLNLTIDETTGQLNKEIGFVRGLSDAYLTLAKSKLVASKIEATQTALAEIELAQEAVDKQLELNNKQADLAAESNKNLTFWDRVSIGTNAVLREGTGFSVSDYKYGLTYALKTHESSKLSKQSEELKKQLEEYQDLAESVTKEIEALGEEYQDLLNSSSSGSPPDDDRGDGGGGGGNGSKKAEDALKKLKSSFDEIISVMEHKISLDKQAGASTEEQIQAYKDLQTETHRQAQVYRSMGLSETHEYIRSLQKLWWQYYDTIQELQKKAYEEEISYQKNLVSALSFYADEQKTSLDKQIEALNEELQALENQNDEREKALELTKAQQNLEDARKQKIRVYQKGQGWTWVSDPRKVAEAEEELESIQRERALEDEKQAIQDRIDAYENQKQAWSDVVSDYGKYQNRLELEMQLGTTIEKAIFGDRTKNIENFKDAYIKAINSMITAQQKLNEMNDIKTTLPSESMIGGTSGGGATATTTGGGGGGGVNKYSSSDDRSVMEAKMKANSKAWHGADSATKKKLESENQKIGKALGMKYTSSTGKWAYASGTTGMPSTQLALVGERGAELGIFPQGTGIIPHNLTQNLMEIGKYSMNQLKAILSKPGGSIDKSSHITINELKVNSNSADNFVRQLQNMVFNQR